VGKVERHQGANQADRWRKRLRNRRRWRLPRYAVSWALILAAIIILSGLIALKAGAASVGCRIKGNVSIATGERIYHVPGQKYYWRTIINPWRGERWFCSEAEARAVDWRKARQ
jgi:hypothetical protein